MLPKLSTILLASLLLTGACAGDSEYLADGDRADEQIDWTTEGIGSKLIDVPLRDNKIGALGEIGLDAHPGLRNLKFHAGLIDSNDPTRILIVDDEGGTLNEGDTWFRTNMYRNENINIIADTNIHPDHAFAFWTQGTKYFAKLTQVNEAVFGENTVTLTLYAADPTPGVLLDAFMEEGDIVEFEDGGKRYQLTLDDVDYFGGVQAEFVIEEGKIDCYNDLYCTNLAEFIVTETTKAVSLDLENGPLAAEVLTPIGSRATVDVAQRVRISTLIEGEELPKANDCADGDCEEDVEPDTEAEERPLPGSLNGACFVPAGTEDAFPHLDGINDGNCQDEAVQHCETSYASGLCPDAADAVRCCLPTPR